MKRHGARFVVQVGYGGEQVCYRHLNSVPVELCTNNCRNIWRCQKTISNPLAMPRSAA